MYQFKISQLQVLFTVFFLLSFYNTSQAQRVTREQLKDTLLPSFSAYRDNYFITGVPLQNDISKTTADAKYQISFKQLVTRHVLPFQTQLFLTYTQKSFWNIYEFSSPFQDVNFNPGIGLASGIYNRNDELTGIAEFKLEHESNGREGEASRSWNSIILTYNARLNNKTILTLRGWFPFGYSDNRDLIDYIGYGEANLSYDLAPKWNLEVSARKGAQWDWKGNVRSRVFYRISKSTNQHLMLEWYVGNAESLIDYHEYENMIRIGYAIKSPDLNLLRGKKTKPIYE
ncbi:phospholipase A [Salinimicrobium sp. MT39]|uniref:Phosphatidylcholine 1-acylhydrolase n=1 Tax=Salinimicrobium profundisediminis TaxID=2994553 RepID=A0A9X3CWY9_9FLAO|nr:phospholipase A [Salinimicrobium profundisediminis]MCX2836985.1 phospholipase A [Salinimicrobium profundisediminis]